MTFGTTTINFQEFETTSTVRVLNAASLTEVMPNASDSMTIGNSAGDGLVTGVSTSVTMVPLQFRNVSAFTLDAALNNGAGGNDTIGVAPGAIVGMSTALIKTGGGVDMMNYDGTSVTATTITFDAGAGNDTLNLTNANAGVPVFLPGAGTTNIANLNSGTWSVAADLGASSQVVNLNVNGGTLNFLGTAHHLNALTLASGTAANLVASANRVLVTKALTMNGTAKLDINDNDLIVDYASSPGNTSRDNRGEGCRRLRHRHLEWNQRHHEHHRRQSCLQRRVRDRRGRQRRFRGALHDLLGADGRHDFGAREVHLPIRCQPRRKGRRQRLVHL